MDPGLIEKGSIAGKLPSNTDMKMAWVTAAVCLLVQGVCGRNYTLCDLGSLPGFQDVRATGINAYGEVVGWCETSNNISHAFLWDNDRMIDLGTFGGTESIAEGINDSGDIVGSYIRDGKRRIFLLKDGMANDLGVADDFPHLGDGHNWRTEAGINNAGEVSTRRLTDNGERMSSLWTKGQDIYFGLLNDGKTSCYALAINDNAQIVGVSHRGDNLLSSGFLWQNGTVTELPTLGGTNAAADGINNSGTIIGWSTLPGGTFTNAHAFLWKDGDIKDLGTLGGNHARAYGINGLDHIVGYSSKTNGKDAAFLWENGQMMNLNDLVITNEGWQLKCGDAINDRGQIVVVAWKDGVTHALLLSPTSESFTNTRSVSVSVPANVPIVASNLRLSSFTRLPNGDFRISFTGASTNRYAVEASTNLTTWSRIGLAQVLNGKAEFVDTNALKFQLRFYRLVTEQ